MDKSRQEPRSSEVSSHAQCQEWGAQSCAHFVFCDVPSSTTHVPQRERNLLWGYPGTVGSQRAVRFFLCASLWAHPCFIQLRDVCSGSLMGVCGTYTMCALSC